MSQEIRSKFKYHLVTHSEHNVIYEDAAAMILVREKYFTENAQLHCSVDFLIPVCTYNSYLSLVNKTANCVQMYKHRPTEYQKRLKATAKLSGTSFKENNLNKTYLYTVPSVL